MNHWPEHKIYVYIALIFGMLFVFLTPPFQSPDEDSHFKRSYQISKGNFYPIEKNHEMGNYFPEEMLLYIDEKLKMQSNRDKKENYSEISEEEQGYMLYDKMMFQNYSTVKVIPIVYIAPAIGIVFSKLCAKIIGLDMVTTAYMLYFARVFSLIVTIIITALAIKITPIRKKTFLTVGLIPMYLFLGSMVTYDNILNASLLLALAIVLNISNEKKKVDIKDILILGVIGVILLNVKTIYFLIFLLMFAVPAKKFGTTKGKIKTGAILLGGILLATVIIKMPYLFLDNSAKDDAEWLAKQTHFVMNHPIKFTTYMLYSIKANRHFQLSSAVGLFGLLDTYNPTFITVLIYLNLFAIGLAEGIREKIKINRLTKALIIIFAISVVIGVYAALYITWTSVELHKIGTKVITGVQGRYFIPIIMPLLLLLSFKKGKDKKVFKIIEENYLLIPCITLLISMCSIFLRFWV